MIANTDGGVPGRVASLSARGARLASETRAEGRIELTLDRARHWLLDQQFEGHWLGELEGDSILESEYILLLAYLGREHEPICRRLCRDLLTSQNPDGSWSNYPGGPIELSGSVKAYFALKLCGMSPDDERMVRARKAILEAGGAQASNSFTRFYLALLGQMSYGECPSVPPELALLPPRLGFSLYAMSSWTRTIVVPLSIWSAGKPVRALPPERGIAELFRDDLPRRPSRRTRWPISWTNFFLAVDRGLKIADWVLPSRLRRPGVKAAHKWMLEHLENSDGLGAIFPPMISTVIALDCLGYERDDPTVQWAHQQLEGLILEDEDGSARVQPCKSPVWDTAIATIALADAGLSPFHPAMQRAVRWLLDQEVRAPGDWQVRRPGIAPAGWHFEYQNDWYPDIDDSAMVVLALHRAAPAGDPEVRAATRRALDWILAMQNRDGGWAAFDVDITNEILTKVPFADHNAMLDPSCADITARVVEMLGTLGFKADDPVVARALDYLWSTQEPEGCWYGRWGVNYIYGTWQVLQGLVTLGIDMDRPELQRAADWIESVQQSCGGWGETCASYDDPSLKGQGLPTASQTAWAVLGLMAAGRTDSAAVRGGLKYLADTQTADGTWDEPEFTATGFPRVFYLKYHLYRSYFPLMALSRYRAEASRVVRPIATPGALASRIPALPLARDV
jgi:squalene-hopene/tetraprenyl-beta-curcumene cyclase